MDQSQFQITEKMALSEIWPFRWGDGEIAKEKGR
jgi:hypothetical protein